MDLVAYNDVQANNNDSDDYLNFPPNNSLVPVVQQSGAIAAASASAYDFQETPTNLQSLTLSMSTTGKGGSTGETGADSTATTALEALPRRSLDTFGQRTSIYRGVTR